VVRWTIPGAILVLTVGLCQLIFLAAVGVSKGHGIEVDVGGAQAVLAFFAGIPLGFLVFQLYFWLWDSVTPRIFFLTPPIDRGAYLVGAIDPADRRLLAPEVARAIGDVFGVANRDIEACLRRKAPTRVSLVESLRLWRPQHARERLRERIRREGYAARRRVHWSIAKYLINYVAGGQAGKVLRAEYMSFNDIYHSLGASMTALVIGTSSFVVYKGIADWRFVAHHRGPALGAVVVIAAGLWTTWKVLKYTRLRTHQLLLDGLAVGIRSALVSRESDANEGTE
jgi:hypothetical protein